MTTLAVDVQRDKEISGAEVFGDFDMIADDIIYEGAAVGDNGSGLARPLVAADPFLGFAERRMDNAGGAASALAVRCRTQGHIVLAVVGATSSADIDETVYASDDATFTLTVGSNTAIGKVARWIGTPTSTTCLVAFQALVQRSL